MAKREITIDKDLLQKNIDEALDIISSALDKVVHDIIVDAVNFSLKGKEFLPEGIEMKMKAYRGKCEDEEPEQNDQLLNDLVNLIKRTTKKDPSQKAVDELLKNLDELFKKQK